MTSEGRMAMAIAHKKPVRVPVWRKIRVQPWERQDENRPWPGGNDCCDRRDRKACLLLRRNLAKYVPQAASCPRPILFPPASPHENAGACCDAAREFGKY